jgi:hypothetical protein
MGPGFISQVPQCLRMPHVLRGLHDGCPASWIRDCVEEDGVSKCRCPLDSLALMDVEPTGGVINLRAHDYLTTIL